MSIFVCGWCGHNGVHGERIPTNAKVRRCSQRQKCEAARRRDCGAK